MRISIAVVPVLLVVTCGPSMTQVYDSNVRFEHCYRLDLDPNIATSHREACWRDWLNRHTTGQTRDRVEYARRQVQRLGAGDATRPRLDVDAPPDAGVAPQAPTEALTPTRADKPPPPVMKEPAKEPTRTGPPDAGPTPPAASCSTDCRSRWNECRSQCSADGGAADGGKAPRKAPTARAKPGASEPGKDPCSCDGDFRGCMRRCFSE